MRLQILNSNLLVEGSYPDGRDVEYWDQGGISYY